MHVRFGRHLAIAAILTTAIVSGCANSQIDPPRGAREKLRQFHERVRANPTADDAVLAALNKLNAELDTRDMPVVESFAISEDAKDFRWPLIRLLVERSRFDASARVAIKALSGESNRQYRFWKWWETGFGDRPDYKAISDHIIDAFRDEFEKGDDATRRTIAGIFGLEGGGPTPSLQELNQQIKHPRQERG